jgi:hypothetical protein
LTLLDDVLPEWHFRERHRRHVDATPERVFAAVREVTLEEMPVANLLVWMRGMHARAAKPMLDEMGRAGFALEAERPLRELVFAAIGRRGSCVAASAAPTRTSAPLRSAGSRRWRSISASTDRRSPLRRAYSSRTRAADARSGATGS